MALDSFGTCFPGVVVIEARKVTGRPTSIPQWAFGEVFRLHGLGYAMDMAPPLPNSAVVGDKNL
jgi:hypothetical protein